MHILYLSIRALSQHFEQLELRGVCFLTTLLNMVADVNFLKYTFILMKERQISLLLRYLHIYKDSYRTKKAKNNSDFSV